MAVTAFHISTSGSVVDASSYVTESVSLSANRLVLLAVTHDCTSSSNQPTVTGASRTWTAITSIENAAFNRITIFRSLSSSANSGACTIDFAAQTQQYCLWSFNEFGEVATTGTNGADAVVQSTANGGTSGTSITATLSAFSNTNNATYGAIAVGASENVSAGTGFTELGEYQNGEFNTIQSQWKATNDTTVDWSWTTSTGMVCAAVEIKAQLNSGFLALL